MKTVDILTIIAIIMGPILAVQIEKFLERKRFRKNRKLHLFHTLMKTRASRLSLEHVQALNMIDIEFVNRKFLGMTYSPKMDKEVLTSWKDYNDHLFDKQYPKDRWNEKAEDLFVDLLEKMSKALNYDFDKVMIKRKAYTPIAFGDIENDQQKIRKGLIDVIEGRKTIKVDNSGFDTLNGNDDNVLN